MEYRVGSIADLITGKNTPNKPRVIEKTLPKLSKESTKARKIKKPGNVQLESSHDKPIKRKNKEAEQADEPVLKKRKGNNPPSNAERRIKKKEREEKMRLNQDPEELSRTIFVGNVPLGIKKEKLKHVFDKHGTIESIRFRGIPVADIKTPKKVAAIKKEFHPDRKSCISYIRFANKEDAEKAQVEDGTIFEEHHLRVSLCSTGKSKPDETKAIFVGNLNFDAEEEDLWKLFEDCGPIANVRIIRDPRSGMGKGFAYVNFKDTDAVQLALEMENVKLKNRELRISLSNLNMSKKKKKEKKNIAKKSNEQKKKKKFNRADSYKKKKIEAIAPRVKKLSS